MAFSTPLGVMHKGSCQRSSAILLLSLKPFRVWLLPWFTRLHPNAPEMRGRTPLKVASLGGAVTKENPRGFRCVCSACLAMHRVARASKKTLQAMLLPEI